MPLERCSKSDIFNIKEAENIKNIRRTLRIEMSHNSKLLPHGINDINKEG